MSIQAIGIDLGTTYSCVGAWQNGKVEIINDEQGSRTVPSCVAFTPIDHLVGEQAKYQASMNPRNTIFEIKRMIGKKYSEINTAHWPNEILNVDSKPYLSVEHLNKKKIFDPIQISAMILTKLHELTERHFKQKIKDVVITVPAHFRDSQRQATKFAGKIAGLNVLRIINEPTAAAIAYGLDRSDKEMNVLVFDFGGGTHDVSLLTIDKGIIEVRATFGNNELGGQDLDRKILEWCQDDFRKRYHQDLTVCPKAVRRLRQACEQAKKNLSSSQESYIHVESLFADIDYQIKLTRHKFEELTADLLQKSMEPIHKVLRDTKLSKSKIDEIILIGGSTRIPKIKELLRNFFDGKSLNESLNPDEAVAYGAAIHAALISGVSDPRLDQLLLIDVTPFTLGVETTGGIMSCLIPRNTALPAKKTKNYTTTQDNQDIVIIKIFQGENTLTADNYQLGVFELTNIPPAPKGVTKIEVVFDIDYNGILQISAIQEGNQKKISIVTHEKQDLNRMAKELQLLHQEDRNKQTRMQSRNNLEQYVFQIKRTITNYRPRTINSKEILERIENICQRTLEYLELHPHESHTTYDQKRNQLEIVWNRIASQLLIPKTYFKN